MKHGDPDNIKNDFQTLEDIFNRQGLSFIYESVSEYIAKSSLKFKLSEKDNKNLFEKNIIELKENLLERLNF